MIPGKPSTAAIDYKTVPAGGPRVLSREALPSPPIGKGRDICDCHGVTRSAVSPSGAEMRDFRRGGRRRWGFVGVDLAVGPARVVFVNFAEIQRVGFVGRPDYRLIEDEHSRLNVERQGVGAGAAASGVRR